MKTFIIVPLATNEQPKFSNSNVNLFYVHSEECYPKMLQHIFWSEIGKYLYCYKEIKKYDCLYGFVQNRRFFKDIEKIELNENEVCLAPLENHGVPILNQFRCCHPLYFEMFKEICEKADFNKELLNRNSWSPHNIFISNYSFFIDYGDFLKSTLTPYFNESFNEKVGAWISQRLLFLFAASNYKIKNYEMITLPKN